MKPLQAILDQINSAVDKYHVLTLKMVVEQSEILRELTTGLYFLEQHRIEANEKWNSTYFQSQGKTNAAKEREADIKCPEIYKIRRIMTGGYKVVDSIRSTISVNRKEG